MTLLAIESVPAITPRSGVADILPQQIEVPGVDVANMPSGFATLIQGGLGALNADVGAAETALQSMAAGKAAELHDVMINLERARISVQTFIQVRNKLIDSYQELMRMQL